MKAQLRLLNGRKIQSPIDKLTRPTTAKVRESVMNILGDKIKGSYWLDLCSGSGVMSCEALQRGAQRIVAVERSKKTAQICRENLLKVAPEEINPTNIQVFCKDVITWLKIHPNKQRFNLVYLDPPYEADLYIRALKQLLNGCWLSKDALVVCEHSSKIVLDTPQPWSEKKRRVYGNSSLLFLSPPEIHLCDIDSKLLPTNQKE